MQASLSLKIPNCQPSDSALLLNFISLGKIIQENVRLRSSLRLLRASDFHSQAEWQNDLEGAHVPVEMEAELNRSGRMWQLEAALELSGSGK